MSYSFQMKRSGQVRLFANAEFTASQKNVNPEESGSPGYQIINAGIALEIPGLPVKHEFSLTANNLFDVAYYNHMSRLKQFNQLNMGRDIVFQYRLKFNKPIKTKP